MKLLLKHSVRSLGRAGEVVTVSPGYARNYLIPQGIAMPATQGNVNLINKYKARRAQEEELLVEQYKEIATRIDELNLVLHVKANASNHLYGSVNQGEIVTQLNNRHINIEKDMVRLDDSIKELGNYEVSIVLNENIKATLKVEILDEHGEIPTLEGAANQNAQEQEQQEGEVQNESSSEEDSPVEQEEGETTSTDS